MRQTDVTVTGQFSFTDKFDISPSTREGVELLPVLKSQPMRPDESFRDVRPNGTEKSFGPGNNSAIHWLNMCSLESFP